MLKHVSVLPEKTIEYLDPKPGDNFIDGTVGGGGHSEKILELISPDGRLLGMDLDEKALERSRRRLEKKFKGRFILVRDNFKNIKKVYKENGIGPISGIIVDLGVSSIELDDPGRGFSFRHDAPLDMRFGNEGKTAGEVVNSYAERKLTDIFKNYGEERFARSIARNICKRRSDSPIRATGELVDIISSSVPAWYRRQKLHFATKTFQALRIETNEELDNLKKFLPDAVSILKKGGRLAVISFHSLEDRIVKQYFKEGSKDCLCPKEIPVCQCSHKASLRLITKKPIVPSPEEMKENPRSRSAKLRVVEKI